MSTATSSTAAVHTGGMTKEHRKVILASSLGTVFEWYDFYLYGSLAAVIAVHFFSALAPGPAFIMALLTFAAGFAVRPFGAIVFGRLGDLIGRKYTFLITIVIMGVSTFLVGVLPTYNTIGIAAPILLVVLRCLQGLALGGEYGGAATYVAEHAPMGKRGLYTSFIQTTATVGLFLSLMVILGCRVVLGNEAFAEWGWRIPFLISFALLIVSIWIRMQLNESPLFQKMKEEGTRSKAPLTESFGTWSNGKIVLLALFGATAGQAVVWYAGQFYALFFMTQTLKVDPITANLFIAAALAIATGGFILFGWLSDKIGRKPIILAGCAIAAVTYFPLFGMLTTAANPDLARAQASAPVTIVAHEGECSFQFDPVGKNKFDRSSCDIAKAYMAKAGINYHNIDAAPGTAAVIRVGDTSFTAPNPAPGTAADKAAIKSFQDELKAGLTAAGYPAKADPAKINKPMVVAILFALVFLVTMVYGPIAALLVELFPSRIRYTSMSLPYHIGNGWFGGFLPTTAFALVLLTGNIYAGLWYPIVIAVMTFIVGTFFLQETKDVDISK